MFPLEAQPGRLSELLKLFGRFEDVKKCVRQQLVGGAVIALSFVRVRHPTLNFQEMHQLPSTFDDRVDFSPHYVVVKGPAARMIVRTKAETEWLLREGARRQ